MFWRIYFFICLFLYFGDILLRLLVTGFRLDWLSFSVNYIIPYCVIVIGIYGFAYSRKIINALFWKIVFIVSIIWEIIDYINYDDIEPFTIDKFDIIFFLIVLPTVYGLFVYAFKSKELWGNKK